jgi:hypothetical protein
MNDEAEQADLIKAGHSPDCEGMIGILDCDPPHYYVVPGTCTCGADRRPKKADG